MHAGFLIRYTINKYITNGFVQIFNGIPDFFCHSEKFLYFCAYVYVYAQEEYCNFIFIMTNMLARCAWLK